MMFSDDPTRLAAQAIPSVGGVVHLSISEVGSVCTRAARGAGLSWGLAEECGDAAIWLARHGLDWAGAVLSRIEGPTGADFVPAPRVWTAPAPICGLRAGVALSDFAALPEGPGTEGLFLGPTFDPIILLPFASRAAAICSAVLRVEIGGVPVASLSANAAVVWPCRIPHGLSGPVSVVRDPSRSDADTFAQTQSKGAEIRDALWAQLDRHALAMTVPSSDMSHRRAGGETPDDD